MDNRLSICIPVAAAEDGESDAVGIVVQNGRIPDEHPRTVAFIWGRKANPTPSLPFGRWKGTANAA